MRKIIFVGGIHGVGKSTLCKEIAESMPINYYSCSELISKKIKIDSVNKKVSNITVNQDILIEAVKEFVPNNIDLLLDGHFCLQNKKGDIEKIPLTTFERLGIGDIIIITNDLNIIVNNLYKRDSKEYKPTFIDEFQRLELEYSYKVSSSINVRHRHFNLEIERELIKKYIKDLLNA